MSLFRPEVAAERARSNWGSVIVTKAPALRWASIALLLACCIGAVLVLRLDYARKVQVAGYPSTRAASDARASPSPRMTQRTDDAARSRSASTTSSTRFR